MAENSKSDIVQDAEDDQHLLDIAAHADPREGIRQGLEEVKAGRVHSAEDVFPEFEARHGLTRPNDGRTGADLIAALRACPYPDAEIEPERYRLPVHDVSV